MMRKQGILINEAVKIVEKAREKNIILRLIGAAAIRFHSPKFSFIQEKLGRELSDIDFMAYGRQRQEIVKFFLDTGYECDKRIISSLIPTTQYVFEACARATPEFVIKFFDKKYEKLSFEELCKAPVSAISGVSESDAAALKKALGIKTVEDLATNEYVLLTQGINSFSKYSGKILDKEFESAEFEELRKKPVSAISGISESDAVLLKKAFGIDTIQELAENKYVMVAQLVTPLISLAKLIGTRAFHVDVFFDKLEMCHTIDFKDQLEVDYPTISLANLLLEKMQIVQLNEKDAIDTTVLLREHDVGEGDVETINFNYISRLLSKDWGFYYTVTTNLKRIKDDFLPSYNLPDEDKTNVKDKIDALLERIQSEPKSLGWKMRARVGAKKKWYRDVEELYR